MSTKNQLKAKKIVKIINLYLVKLHRIELKKQNLLTKI